MIRALRLAALALVALALALHIAPQVAVAQAYPSKPVKIVVPFPPGGGVDALGRIIQPGLQEKLGQPVVIENKAGAAGAIGVESTVKSAPDGYTIVIGAPGAISVAPALNRNLAYNPAKDLLPITMGVRMPNLLVVNPGIAAKSVAELIALAKAQPGKIAFASGGVGTGQQLSGELFKIMGKVDMLHVPYKGTAPAITDLINGQVALSFSDPSVLPHVAGGRLRLIAQTGPTRSPLYPDVPTVAESGLPGFSAINWYAFFAPAGTPADIIKRLNTDLAAVLSQPDVKAKLEAAGMSPAPSTPEDLATFVAADTKLWGEVVAAAGIKME